MADDLKAFALMFAVMVGTVSQNALSQSSQLPSIEGKTEQTGYRAAEFWFNSLPVDDRIKIQFALIWTGSFDGFVDGLFGPQTDHALRHFEGQIGVRQDGRLGESEKARLLMEAAREMEALDFRVVVDPRTNLEFGLPHKLFGQSSRSVNGTRWETADGNIHLSTKRVPSGELTFEQLYEVFSYETITRRVILAKFRPDFFIVTGVDSGQKFYMRYLRLDRSSGGISITWPDSAIPEMSRLVAAMSNSLSFQDRNPIFTLPDAPPSTPSTTTFSNFGTGFFVSALGHVLTNDHVVKGCTKAAIRLRNGDTVPANIRIRSESDDLAVLKADLTNGVSAYFTKDPGIQLGSSVIVFGYPLTGQLTREGNVSVGLVAALAGVNDDQSKFQISAAVQSGNSGGPVLDQSGNVIGVVVAKSDLREREEGDYEVLQNVNFAIKSSVATDFLYNKGIPYTTQSSIAQRETTVIVEAARNFTVGVACAQ